MTLCVVFIAWCSGASMGARSFSESWVHYNYLKSYPFKATDSYALAHAWTPVFEYYIEDRGLDLSFYYKFYQFFKSQSIQWVVHREYIHGLPFLSVYPWWKIGKVEKQFLSDALRAWCILTWSRTSLGQLSLNPEKMTVYQYDLSLYETSDQIAWKCLFTDEFNNFPFFIFNKEKPDQIVVIIIWDGLGGVADESRERTLKFSAWFPAAFDYRLS